MSYENPRKQRLLKEALGDERANLPSFAATCWTVGLIAASLAIVALAGLNLPESTAAVTFSGYQRHAELTLPLAPDATGGHPASADTPAETVPAPTETGNVVDLTF